MTRTDGADRPARTLTMVFDYSDEHRSTPRMWQ
ncbi:hypothetical protein LAUMK191_02655 [Mycobacterium attenuatum]|uniref:Uncharacterized protein n=1 Tax=Mycobacterium attenuatum TaxID=2341086 RepID=A0A498PZ12_9MYCO|nr:hypothetical protein LAUMK136_02690 [Mycobacterium attenuatum]VBA53091.1 hypothetical protein LAUMK191_02655 [Mycobacterium attenuatum]VBA57974.1 hypothetical protein LAUMK41_02732 [Mycobacterium attenuatum]